ncbi:MAG: alpha/beta fold hydrolase [Candidatus Nanopelagicales bacterium]|nr:alpha/beta fold hydrolase [Candidatus Nanopelagicales bacterium]MDZ4248845.1 alpha/beta fold hydrolase [Candidatus Nanopelagicales bacterium]MDZ7578378.1 alpha/beta fold hydrolase [Candidatus Nanopelagicales bacterium]
MLDERTAPHIEEMVLTGRLLGVRRVDQVGTPAVFIHGLGGSSLNWTDLAYEMAGRLSSWAVDLPGFGVSPPPADGDYSLAGHADAVAALIDEKIGRRVHLFGNSMGGAVSVLLAAQRPEIVRSLTLISPALPGSRPTRMNAHLPVIAVSGVGERVLARYARATADFRVKTTMEACFADPDQLSPQRIAEAVAEVERRDGLPYVGDAFLGSLRGLMRSMVDTGPDRLLELAGRIECPVLLVYGRRDRLVDPGSAHRIAARFPDARVVVIPHAGHVAQMEHPELVARTWRDLIGSPHPAAEQG